jgi:outer membrane autotransporter protein
MTNGGGVLGVALTTFSGSTSAGTAALTNTNYGATSFLNSSTAGNATIIANANGVTAFLGTSTAGTANITANAGGYTEFSANSTAGNSTITTNSGGFTEFSLSSTAGNATITTYSGGQTLFYNSSTGGQARFITNAGGVVDISSLTSGGMTAGSIAGAGNYALGANSLTVGQNNLSTLVSGTITNGGIDGGSGGALIKVGTGTLTLTGTNTYSGGTSFNGGIVAVNSSSNLGAGPLSFNGGTLEALATGGGITSSKAVTLNSGGGTFSADSGTTSTLSGAITGAGSFTTSGPGTLILSGANTYSGATTVAAGTLRAGSTTGLSSSSAFTVSSTLDLHGFSSTIGSLAGTGNVTNGASTAATLTAEGNNSSTTFSGTLTNGAGTLALTKTGTGTLILSGTNTYTGGTVISAGTLTVNSAQALGLGNVVVNGGTLRADPQPINVKGNYTQNAGGTLDLQVAGASSGQYDTLTVGGNASLGGTLQLLNLGFVPKAGNQLTLVTTGGVVSNKFAHFIDPFATGSGYNTVELVYGKNSVLLEFLNLSMPVSELVSLNLIASDSRADPPADPPADPAQVIATLNFESFALTPNQRAAGNILDEIHLDPRATDLMNFLYKQPVSELPGDLEQFSPDALTAFYEISFSNANIQRLNLEARLADVRDGSNGFSSNMKTNSASVNLQDKAAVESSKNPVEQALQPGPENRWGVWVTGSGDFVNVDGDDNAHGYDFTTGGVSVGLDYRITDQLAIGIMGEYSHTWTSLEPSGDIDVDSGRGGVYATWFTRGFYLEEAIYGGHNSYSSSRASLQGMASGGTGGSELSTFISGGYDFHAGHLTVGPIATLQYTYANIDSFSEHGSLAPLAIHSQSAESLRTDFGFRASYGWQAEKVLVEPFVEAAWEHEYKYSALPITAGFAGVPAASDTFYGPSEGHDSAIVSAGVTVQWTPMIATYVNYDGQLGRDRYDSNAVTGGVRVSF